MKVLTLHGSKYSKSSGNVEIQERNWALLHQDQDASISYVVTLDLIGVYRLQIMTLAGSQEAIPFGGSVYFDNELTGDIKVHHSSDTNNVLNSEFMVNVGTRGQHTIMLSNRLIKKNLNEELSRINLRIVEMSMEFDMGTKSVIDNPDTFTLHKTIIQNFKKYIERKYIVGRLPSKNEYMVTDDVEYQMYAKEILFQQGSEYSCYTGYVEIQERNWAILHPVPYASISYDITICSVGMHRLQIKTLAGSEENLLFGGRVYFDNEFIGDIGIHWSTDENSIFINNFLLEVTSRGQHTITISNEIREKNSNKKLCSLHLRIIEISMTIKPEVRSVINNPTTFGVNEEFIEILKEHIYGLKEIKGGELYENNFMGHVGAEHFKIYTEYINKFKEISESVVLELGCGSGGSLPMFRSYGAKVAGIEVDLNLVKLTNARIKFLKNAYCIQADGFHLPFAAETFDICVCSHVLEHVDGPHEIVEEINRVLKTGGIALIEFPNRLYPVEPHGNLFLVPYLPLKLARLYASILSSMWFISDEYRSRLNVMHLLKGEYSYFSINNILKKLPFGICDVNPVDRLVLDHPVFEKYPNKVKRLLSLLISRNVTIIVKKTSKNNYNYSNWFFDLKQHIFND